MNDNQQQSEPTPVDQDKVKFQKAQQSFWERLIGTFSQVDYPADRISPHAGARKKP